MLVSKLIIKYIKSFTVANKIKLKKYENEKLAALNITVKINDNNNVSQEELQSLSAQVDCIFCSTPQTVGKFSNRWIISNYQRHLKRCHINTSKTKTIHEPNANSPLVQMWNKSTKIISNEDSENITIDADPSLLLGYSYDDGKDSEKNSEDVDTGKRTIFSTAATVHFSGRAEKFAEEDIVSEATESSISKKIKCGSNKSEIITRSELQENNTPNFSNTKNLTGYSFFGATKSPN
jgi:hypothetical protein